MQRRKLLSYSWVVAVPGRMAVFVAAIAAWIVLVGAIFGAAGRAAAGNPGFFTVLGAMMLLPIIAGPLFGGMPLHVEVGADGLETRWLVWRRFVPYRDITAIRVEQGSIEVCVRQGGNIWLRPARYVGGRRKRLMYQEPQSSDLLKALEAGHRAALAASTESEDDSAKYARGDRPGGEWASEVLARGGAGGNYRDAALDRDELLRIAEHPVADPTARGAAAVLLARQRIEPEERQRLRIAADATAQPELRIALEAASEEEASEAELGRALKAIPNP